MAIREFSPEGTRSKIAYFGDLPLEERERFRDRNFALEESTLEKLREPTYAAQLDAALLLQDPGKLNTLARELGAIVPGLLDQDVRVYVRLATDQNSTNTPRRLVVDALQTAGIPVANLLPEEWRAVPEDRRERENSFLSPCVYIFDSGEPWAGIATLICDRPAGPPPNSQLDPNENFLRERLGELGHRERVLLLKRAFWNCRTFQLAPLLGGMSGAPVFKAYAALDAGLVPQGAGGGYPHLYFVKIGPRKKIVDEYDKYCGYIFEHVPFHLGPRLRRERCNLGTTQGILVGDFVEGAEFLVESARGSRCVHAMANLFDTTLGGWRKQGTLDSRRSLSDYMERKWFVEGTDQTIRLPPARANLVRELGGRTAVAPLRRSFERKGRTPPLVAPAHGDMHATNVLVRHGDAILIDFEKLEPQFPLTFDPASLEGGLLVEGFIADFKEETIDAATLVELIEPLYERRAFRRGAATHGQPGSPAEWFFGAVNQIRTHNWSSENEPGQYALTLALCLIRKGCNTHEALEGNPQTTSRAIAFYFGQKILREFAARKSAVDRTSAQANCEAARS